jgi:hypothetical protein
MHPSHGWELSSALSSEARFRIMQVLCGLRVGLRLRELERATELSIRSIQVATEGLLKEKVLRVDQGRRYTVNSASSIGNQVLRLFLAWRDEETRRKAELLSDRARLVVRLSDEVARFVKTKRDP